MALPGWKKQLKESEKFEKEEWGVILSFCFKNIKLGRNFDKLKKKFGKWPKITD